MVEHNSIEIGIARLLFIPIVYSGLEKRIFYPNHHFARIAIPTRYTDYYSLIRSTEILTIISRNSLYFTQNISFSKERISKSSKVGVVNKLFVTQNKIPP